MRPVPLELYPPYGFGTRQPGAVHNPCPKRGKKEAWLRAALAEWVAVRSTSLKHSLKRPQAALTSRWTSVAREKAGAHRDEELFGA